MDSEKSYKKEESDFIPGDSSPEPQQESRIKRKKKKNQKLSQLCLK